MKTVEPKLTEGRGREAADTSGPHFDPARGVGTFSGQTGRYAARDDGNYEADLERSL